MGSLTNLLKRIKRRSEEPVSTIPRKGSKAAICTQLEKELDVVITTFKPFNYLFGGLNQGMVIVAVNGVEIKNKYELDKQLARYKKGDNVCLKVIKKDGKKAFYHVEV